jgi:hypothetical protein
MESLAENYIIKGEIAEKKGIALDRSLVEMNYEDQNRTSPK